MSDPVVWVTPREGGEGQRKGAKTIDDMSKSKSDRACSLDQRAHKGQPFYTFLSMAAVEQCRLPAVVPVKSLGTYENNR